MKVVVTGGAGFIGSCLIWKLNEQGIDDIIAVDIGEKKDSENLAGKKIADYIERDKFLELVNSDKLDKNIDMVIHFGACTDTTERDSAYLAKNNYLYSKKLAEWCLKNGKRYIYASSAATYGAGELGYSDKDDLMPSLKPLNEYGNSKQLFDLWVLENKLQEKLVGFKFFNVYGPNEYHKADMRSMINKGYHQIKETGKIRLFKSHKPEYKDGQQKRDFIYVKDSVEVVWYFIENPTKFGIYNLGTGQAHTWNDLANALFLALDIEPNIEYFDMPENLRNQYQYFTEAELTKLRAAGCDYKFSSLKKAVKDYISYLEAGSYL
ncbi:MAG: ADP-glyceromanno-heptose 6-epimerase [Candidatus Omnitrophica bacterium]|nr:ADP-glyceromanno-heptose 6-epimerase [Candidatus Omnitrophota bacterium]